MFSMSHVALQVFEFGQLLHVSYEFFAQEKVHHNVASVIDLVDPRLVKEHWL